MPVIAVALVRAILSLRVPQIRLLAGSTVAALALHHVVTLQVAFRNIAPDSTRPSIGNVTMWDHQTYLSGLREYYGLRDPPDDFRIPETIDLLTRLGFRADARIGTLQTTHPFFQPNGLQLEATRRELAWTFVWSPPIDTNGASVSRAIPSAVDVLLVRTGGPTGIDLSSIAPALPTGLRAADALTLGDGSTVTVFTTIR
jgi:hypothetical protein